MKKEQLVDLYHQMVLIRRVEERGAELYQAGKIGGFMHLYIGQEAVSTGLIAAREPRARLESDHFDARLRERQHGDAPGHPEADHDDVGVLEFCSHLIEPLMCCCERVRERATRTERAVEAARERACAGVRGAQPLG